MGFTLLSRFWLTANRQPLTASILAIPSIRRFVGGDHGFVAVADGQQLVFGHDVLAAVLHVVLMDAGFDDRIDRAGFFAKAAIDALKQIDIVARRASRAVRGDIRLDGNGQRGTNGFAQLARDATLLAVRIATLRMQTAIARRLWGL